VTPRLLVLDAVINAPEVTWLPTAPEKAEHFVTRLHVPVECLPNQRHREDEKWVSRLFPDALPVGIDAADRMLFVHPVTPVLLEGFGPFLRRHRALLASLSAWTLRLVVSPDGRSEEPLWQAVVAREIGSLLHLPDQAERRVDWHVLPRYGHLSPLVDQAHRARLRADQGVREGEHRHARPQPPRCRDEGRRGNAHARVTVRAANTGNPWSHLG